MMIKWYVYFEERNGRKCCHCFEHEGQQAKHFASNVNGNATLEINGYEIRKIIEHTYGTHIYMKLLIGEKEYEVDCHLRNDGEYFKTTADDTEYREMVISAFKQLRD